MAGRIRTAIISLEPARAVCHPLGPERSGGDAQRFDTPLAEASHARHREPFDAGDPDNGGGTGCAGCRLISSVPVSKWATHFDGASTSPSAPGLWPPVRLSRCASPAAERMAALWIRTGRDYN